MDEKKKEKEKEKEKMKIELKEVILFPYRKKVLLLFRSNL